MGFFCQHLKWWYFHNQDVEKQKVIFTYIEILEKNMHPNAEERYLCILKNYGDTAVTERICCPRGTIIDRLKNCIQCCFSGRIKWHILDIVFSFLCLCTHIFDHIKDIDLTVTLNHFDTKVIQRAYYQYNDFNLSYLTYTSLCLLIVSHIVIAFYWALLRNKPKVTIAPTKKENRMIKFARLFSPYLPMVLPILLFCRLTELKLHLHALTELDEIGKYEFWRLMEEKILVRDTANDVKIIEMVTESFGQLIVTSLLLVRFQWLLEKDFRSFGINFNTYIIATMTVSFLSLLHAIFKYHNRHRRSLRPLASLGTPLLLFAWSMLVVTKVFVYVVAFINTPGFFFVPAFIKMLVAFVLFQFLVDDFKKKQSHEKFIYILISFLLPVSLPSKDFKSMKKLNIINFMLYFLECTGVLAFAFFMKHFYHNQHYCQFYEKVPQIIIGYSPEDNQFELFLVLMLVVVLFVTLLSSLLLWLHAEFLHPKKQTF
eukprot:GFUD01036733.1.p1 GENE.GFUD01036733.1~~GFUD01036733.1.p1  ORF type:complete len:485 (-),score=53.95 GFUD01036733.1:343-1797(-)